MREAAGPPPHDALVVRGARTHNLRDVSLTLPHGRLVVFTGVSGSGKSSLAFDTLYAEGQRRYVASLSNYARQFLDQLPRPDVDFVGGIPPALCIDQKLGGRNPRSTVGTLTEVYDFLRVLWARLGEIRCAQCGRPVGSQGREAIVRQAAALQRAGPLLILAPLVQQQRGAQRELLADLRRQGFLRVRIDGALGRTDELRRLSPTARHTIEAVVDRLGGEPVPESRLWEAVDTALGLGQGRLILAPEGGADQPCSLHRTCPGCGRACEEPTPASFSFNIPQGWCPTCQGLGTTLDGSLDGLVDDPSRSIAAGALGALGPTGRSGWAALEAGARQLGIDLRTPWRDLPPAARQALLHGGPGPAAAEAGEAAPPWRGLLAQRPDAQPDGDDEAQGPPRPLRRLRTVPCPACGGARLRPESLAVRLGGRHIGEAAALPLGELASFLEGLPLGPTERAIGGEALLEAGERLRFLSAVGVDYLSLNRPAPSLSGGEAQRIRLAAQVGRGLSGVLYVLDEPSIGLHQRDNRRLIATLQALRDRGSTVVVVEHDEETMRCADLVVDFGPGAGDEGGHVVAVGPARELARNPASLTGRYLAGREAIPVPERRRAGGPGLRIVGAHRHNLRDLSVDIPAGILVCVTGVSGSGKSTLVHDVLLANAREHLAARDGAAGPEGAAFSGCRRIEGLQRFDKVIAIDQSPIGRIPRSNPATYTGLWDEVRALYAQLPEARLRGYPPGRFSFNVPGGRCPVCEGNGARRIDMDFLPDAWVECDACHGTRFSDETLQVRYRGASIAAALEMTVRAAREHFGELPRLRRSLDTLVDVGLDYLRLGQPAPTLSGGEAQRIKLARELSRRGTGRTLYVLDEPTTGLHFRDVQALLQVLQRLVAAGNTVLVVEHNLDVVKVADHVIDLGPEAGAGGGRLLCAGTPEEVAADPASATGAYLREVLTGGHVRGRRRPPAAAGPDRGALLVTGARQHNLRDLTVRLPKERLIAFAGPSGAGKTSLALDTIYAEGQRRYVESLSAYARQFLGRAPRPAVDRVDGLCPAIAVDQRAVPPNSRSTVGTLTEAYDYLRLLFARAGEPRCPSCGGEVRHLGGDQLAGLVAAWGAGRTLAILAPAELGDGDLEAWCRRHQRAGYARLWWEGTVLPLDPTPALEAAPGTEGLALVVDRVPAGDAGRLAEAVAAALAAGEGPRRGAVGAQPATGPARWWREGFACVACGATLPPLAPHTFSFNDPRGWCPVCAGTGVERRGQWETLVPDPGRSLRAGGMGVWGPLAGGPMARLLEALGARHGFTLDAPLGGFDRAQREVLLRGDPEPLEVDLGDAGGGHGRSAPVLARYAGLWAGLDLARAQTHSGELAAAVAALFTPADCPSCAGSRLAPQGRAVLLCGRTLPELLRLPLRACRDFFEALPLPADADAPCAELRRELRSRLRFLCEVGLDYLTLGRSSGALSGGEGQRIRLASQLGSGLTGVLYVLDEPTVGLHPRDTDRLLQTLAGLRALGNTVLAVDHDAQLLEAADHLVEFGPGSGSEGGAVIAEGPPALLRAGASRVGRLLRGEGPRAGRRRRPQGAWLEVRGARHHNLRAVDCALPLGNLVAVTGVSGSGKTSLVIDTLYADLARRLHRAQTPPGPHDGIRGAEALTKVVRVDQEPIGDSPRSNAATYTGIFDTLRHLYARVPEARAAGFTANHFSYNHPSGQCDGCQGRGQRRIQMHFLPDVWVPCEACAGRRYRGDVLQILYRGLTIADCLGLTVRAALARFANLKSIRPTLETLEAVGLGYLGLGQPAPTLSAGEAQRLKLGRELARPHEGHTLYVLDEPTTGLSADEVGRLLAVLDGLVDAGHTVVCIEHNLDVMAAADWVIDLGPEGGEAGGEVVAAGPPETVAQAERSRTAPFLARALAAPLDQGQGA